MKYLPTSFALFACALLATSCQSLRSPKTARPSEGTPAHIIFFIGDGMGAMQAQSTREVLATNKKGFRLSFEDFPVVATQHTRSASSPVTDSAASSTAMACGVRTTNGYLGKTPDGSNLVSIASIAHERGWKVGLLTSQSMDHATPAGFYAHVTNRRDYATISCQLAKTPFDFIGGGALRGRYDGLRAPPSEGYGTDYLACCASNGYLVVKSREAYPHIAPTARVFAVTEKVLPKFESAFHAKDSGEMRLRDFTEAALNHFGESPFFLMVEGGQIDTACHRNDFGTMVRETEEFDEAVRVALDYARTHSDVLIIVTADHETGGLTRIEPAPENIDPALVLGQREDGPTIFETLLPLAQVKAPFNDVQKALAYYFGKNAFTQSELRSLSRLWEEEHNAYGFTMEAAKFFAARAGYVFTAGSHHTGTDVPVYVYGTGAEKFAGVYDNTSLFDRFKQLIEHPGK